MIGKAIGKEVSIGILGTIAGLFVAILVPIVIMLMQNPQGNSWDAAVIQRKIVKLPSTLVGFLLLCLPIIFWNLLDFRMLLILTYFAGLFLIGRVLILASLWLSDWSDNGSSGVKYKWRLETLIDKRLSFQEQLVVWNSYLSQINVTIQGNRSVLSDGSQFFGLFKLMYSSLSSNVDNQAEFLNTVFPYLKNIFESPRNREDEFISFVYTEYLRSDERQQLATSLQDVIVEEAHNAQSSYFRTQILLNTLNTLNVDLIASTTVEKLQTFTKMVCNLALNQDGAARSNLLLRDSIWKVGSNALADTKLRGRIQKNMLQSFWGIVADGDAHGADTHERFAQGTKIDHLVETIFTNADPITLGGMYLLFSGNNIPITDEDLTFDIYARIRKFPVFGYIGRGANDPMERDVSDDDFRIKVAKQLKSQEIESFKIARSSFLMLRNKHTALAVIKQYMKALSGTKMSTIVKNANDEQLAVRVKVYEQLINRFTVFINELDA